MRSSAYTFQGCHSSICRLALFVLNQHQGDPPKLSQMCVSTYVHALAVQSSQCNAIVRSISGLACSLFSVPPFVLLIVFVHCMSSVPSFISFILFVRLCVAWLCSLSLCPVAACELPAGAPSGTSMSWNKSIHVTACKLHPLSLPPSPLPTPTPSRGRVPCS